MFGRYLQWTSVLFKYHYNWLLLADLLAQENHV